MNKHENLRIIMIYQAGDSSVIFNSAVYTEGG